MTFASLFSLVALLMPATSAPVPVPEMSVPSPMPARAAAPLRLGVVGLTHDHVHWILGREKLGDVEIVGIVERNRELAGRLTQRYGISMDLVFDTMDEMVRRTSPAAVAAFGSIQEHLGVVEFAAPRGLHVMVEKPLAVSLDHARRMKALADQHRIRLMVNYETSWYPTLHEAVRMVESDQIGAVRKVVVRDGHRGPFKIGVSQEFLRWLTDPEQNGAGALTDFGCYGANLMTYLMRGARPATVTAITQNFQPNDYPDVDDEATIILAYPSAQAVIQASWNWPISRKDMEIYGVRGYVMTDNRSQIRVRASEAAAETTRLLPEPGLSAVNDPFAYFKALIDGGMTPTPFDPSSLENNMLVMEILDAARRSAAEHRTVFLPR
jgi:predicted dehydrogenase